MNKISIAFIIAFFALIHVDLTAQEKTRWSGILSVGNQEFSATTFKIASLEPAHNVRFRPQFALGIAYDLRSRKNHTWIQDVKLSFANDTYVENQYTIETNTSLRQGLFKGIFIEPSIGIGYQRAYASDVVYAYEDNKWQSVNNPTAPVNRVTGSAGLNIGYRWKSKLDIMVGRNVGLVLPYIPDDVAPLAPFVETNLSCRIQL